MCLTVSKRLGTGSSRQTPQVHQRMRDVGSPGKIDRIDVVENQIIIPVTRIDPIRIPITVFRERSQEEQEKHGAAVDFLNFANLVCSKRRLLLCLTLYAENQTN